MWTYRIRPGPLLIVAALLLLLIAVRWIWHDWLSQPHAPSVSQGVLDLQGIALEQTRSFPMDGEWRFYPGQWLDASTIDQAGEGRLLQVPGNWSSALDPTGGTAYGYGTYHVRILLDQPLSEPISIWFQAIHTASEVEINGKVLTRSGVLSETAAEHVAKTQSQVVTYMPMQPDVRELDLFVRTANHISPVKGGIVRSVQFGMQDNVSKLYMYSNSLQWITISFLLLHGLYAFIVYLMDGRKTYILAFVMTMILAAFTVGTKHNKLLLGWSEISFVWEMKAVAFSYMFFNLFLHLIARHIFGNPRRGGLFWSYIGLLAAYSLFLLTGPDEATLYSIEKSHYMLLYYIPALWSAYYFIHMVINRVQGALFLLFAVLSFLNNIIWGTIYYAGTSQFMFYPVDLIVAISCFSAFWLRRYFIHSRENELLNAQLAEANRLKDRFLANTSHELRTPLNGILNLAQNVLGRQRQQLDGQSQRDMELLVKVSRRMSHMLNDLLDVIRLQDKQIRLRLRPVKVQSLAAGVVDMLRFLTEGRKVELVMHMPDSLPPVRADEERLVQVLVNLAHNALKYTETGTVELGAEPLGDRLRLFVRDTGPGMDKATRERVFRRYEQGNADGGGLGLGLSICKELVELHGGELNVRSEPGQGSEFSFMLQLADAASSAAQPPAVIAAGTDEELLKAYRKHIAAAVADEAAEELAPVFPLGEREPLSVLRSGRIRVLAVDDDPVNLNVLVQLLAAHAYTTVTARSGAEALDILDDGPWDLIISDVMMPGMSGYELTKRIRQRFTPYELPVLLLTARGEPNDVYAGFIAGANDYVTKPVDGTELLHRAHSLTSQRRAVNERLRMEAAYLQAQIHPHFLFNTLNAIVALGDIDSEKMRELAEAFTSYLRISFDFLSASEQVPLAHELELAEHYLYIEQQRFEDRLQVEWDIAEGLEEVPIPPLTIQPLVENAVRHGVLSRKDGGTVIIRIERMAGAVRCSVSDNGGGIEPEQLAALFRPDAPEAPEQWADPLSPYAPHASAQSQKRRGIGLFNTNSRLLRLFGQGLQIDSVPGKGTTVSFAVPCPDEAATTA